MGAVTAQPPPLDPILQAVVDVLDDAGIVVGDGVAVRGADPSILTNPPNAVVTFISHPMLGGSMASFQQDIEARIQISSIGTTREQADMLRDLTRAALTRAAYQSALDTLLAASTQPNTEPRSVQRVELVLGIPAERDERGLPEPVFMSRDQWIIAVVPVESYAGG